MARANAEYDKSVFINCPFDGDYSPMFEAVVFTIFDCGFQVRCARALRLSKEDKLTFNDYTSVVSEWLKENS